MTLIGYRSVHDIDSAAGSWLKDPDTAASEIASKPATNLDDPMPHRYWQSGDASVANTKLTKDMGREYLIKMLSLHRFNGSQDSHVRTVLGSEEHGWARRWMVGLGTKKITSTADITLVADYTFECWVRFKGFSPTVSVALAYLGTSNVDGSRDWRLIFTSGGLVRFQSERMQAGDTDVNSTTGINDGQWHHIAMTFNDTSNLMSLYVDYVLENTGTETKVVPVGPVTTAKLEVGYNLHDYYEVSEARLWNTDLSLTQLEAVRCKLLEGTEENLELCWEMQDGSGTAIVDTAVTAGTPNHSGTASGAVTWGTWLNPYAKHDSGYVDRWGPWRTRRMVRYDGVGDVSATSAGLATSVNISGAFTMRLPSTLALGATNPVIMMFGTAFSASTVEFVFYVNKTSGDFIFQVNRFTSGTLLTWATDLKDDALHRIHFSIDGIADTMSLWVDGAAHASNGQACDPYSAQTSQILAIGGESDTTNPIRCDFAGDIVIWGKTTTPADDKPYQYLPLDPEADRSILGLYRLDEGTGDEEIKIVNYGNWGTAGDFTTAASIGTPDWARHIRRDEMPIVSPATTLPATVPGVDDDANRPAQWIEEFSAAVDGRYVAVDVIDPRNADGGTQIGVLGVWECSAHTFERKKDTSRRGGSSPSMTWSPDNLPVRGLGGHRRQFRAAFPWLTEAEAIEAEHWVRRSVSLEGAMLFALALATTDRIYWPWTTIYGVPRQIEEFTSMQFSTEFHGFELTIEEVVARLD